jgi:hypothetical protein
VVAWAAFLVTALAFFLRPLINWRRTPAPAQA